MKRASKITYTQEKDYLRVPSGKNVFYEQMNKLCYLFQSIIVFFICCGIELLAQELPDPGPIFPTGVWGTGASMSDPNQYSEIDTAGFNWILMGVSSTNQQYLSDFNVVAQNASSAEEAVYHYSNGKYKKWDAERDDYRLLETGFKHPHPEPWGTGPYLYGESEYYIDAWCWATDSAFINYDPDVPPIDSILWGPNYLQEKNYKMHLYNTNEINYFVNYRIALKYAPPAEDTVCQIYVRYRYAEEENGEVQEYHEEILDSLYLTAEDLPGDTFHVFTLDYWYPEQFTDQVFGPESDYPFSSGTYYTDNRALTGIEFCLKWYRKGKLYIDYVEVYDGGIEGIWSRWINAQTRDSIVNDITSQLNNYQTGWDNIKYWFVEDEPASLDSYEPFRIVDSLVYDIAGKRTITQFHPAWNGARNGDSTIQKLVELAKPEKVMIDYFPFWANKDAEFGFNFIRPIFEQAARYDPDFYYVPQGFGQFIASDPPFQEGDECGWRYPDSTELKGSIFLALAHGAKGIITWKFATNLSSHADAGNCPGELVQWKCLAESLQTNYTLLPLGQMLSDNVNPRLNGKLGKTLLSLDYTKSFFNIVYHQGENPLPDPIWRYFHFKHYGNDYYWHVGFLQQKNFIDNEYFLIVNQRVDDNRTVNFEIDNITNYQNVSVRNIEGGSGEIDTTVGYNAIIELTDEFPPGEGKLYQVAPVVKYGGRLIYDEEISSSTTLYDEMIIENGAELSISANYNCYANIIVKDGEIIRSGNGKLIFHNGFKLIVEGSADINGTAQNKLEIDFSDPLSENGILVDSLGSLDINNCIIKNAEIGISVEPYYTHIDIDSVDFEDCGDFSISISGPTSGGDPTGIPYIQNSSIESSDYGIMGVNLTEIIVKDNTITDTDLGIDFSSVSNSTVLRNVIISENEEMPGILFVSSNGEIRGNTIEGHTNGIQLGNSSPDIGDNEISDNIYHGIYVGAGSLPNMVGKLAGKPPVIYPISGYNKIYENGGYNRVGGHDDGSEIYIYYANVEIDSGCNSIYDDRVPSAPLDTTLLLMNGVFSGIQLSVDAEGNYWGDTVYTARFGSLNVDYEPYYLGPCALPQEGGGGEGLLAMNSGGEVIDTLYPVEATIPELTTTELLYAEAEEDFITANYTDAKEIYVQILNSQVPLDEKVSAYRRVYQIGKLTSQSPEFFNDLGATFTSLASTAEDSLMKKIFNQYSTLCLVSEGEYISAITEFDEVVQQNQGSEEAVYAEIDALTTALLVDGNDSTMLKGSLGKYLVKTPSGYFEKLNGLLRKHFGANNGAAKENLLPTEYTLYQNYPNPFNPLTTIEYDLPRAGSVKLVVYDILGREVKILINAQQQAGRHNVNFNASLLASGVYLYRLSINGFVDVKKMILLK